MKQFNSKEKRHRLLLRLPESLHCWIAEQARLRKQSVTATIIEILLNEKGDYHVSKNGVD